MIKNFTLSIALLFSFFCQAQIETPNFPSIALTNNVKFHNSEFDNPLAGCAFLMKYKQETFAITCKHALWVAKTDKMNTICFNNELKEWRMQAKDDSTNFIIAGELINKDCNETIGEQNVNSDYLIFKIKENHSTVTPLTISNKQPEQNDTLYSIGWTFDDKTGPQRIYTYKYYKHQDKKHLMEFLGKQSSSGISGGAVVNKNKQLVGIVSDFTRENGTGNWYYSPCDTKYLFKELEKYYSNL